MGQCLRRSTVAMMSPRTAYLIRHLPVVSQIASFVSGPDRVGFLAIQIGTATILILAANTAFADFPRLASILSVTPTCRALCPANLLAKKNWARLC